MSRGTRRRRRVSGGRGRSLWLCSGRRSGPPALGQYTCMRGILGSAAAYLCPVELVVREARLVEAAEQAQNVRVEVELAEILAVLIERASLVPAFGDARVVLPGVEQLQVLIVLPIDHFEREVLVQLWDVAAVADRSRVRFRLAGWVECVDWLLRELHSKLLVLRHSRILGQGLPDRSLSSIASSPDRT